MRSGFDPWIGKIPWPTLLAKYPSFSPWLRPLLILRNHPCPPPRPHHHLGSLQLCQFSPSAGDLKPGIRTHPSLSAGLPPDYTRAPAAPRTAHREGSSRGPRPAPLPSKDPREPLAAPRRGTPPTNCGFAPSPVFQHLPETQPHYMAPCWFT